MSAISLIFGSLPTWEDTTSTVHDLKIKRNDKDLSLPCEKTGRHYVVSAEMKNKCSKFQVKSWFPSYLWYLGQAFSFTQIKSLHLLSFILLEIISNTITAIITTFSLLQHTLYDGENQLLKQTKI